MWTCLPPELNRRTADRPIMIDDCQIPAIALLAPDQPESKRCVRRNEPVVRAKSSGEASVLCHVIDVVRPEVRRQTLGSRRVLSNEVPRRITGEGLTERLEKGSWM